MWKSLIQLNIALEHVGGVCLSVAKSRIGVQLAWVGLLFGLMWPKCIF
jgi:threonine/homoserine efflux transporter RhtA